MKKKVIFSLLALSMFLVTGCSNEKDQKSSETDSSQNVDSSKDSQGPDSLPGVDRMWFYQDFYSINETVTFVEDLYGASSNKDFSIGISNFELPKGFEKSSIKFSGHIDSNYGNNSDIYHSVYDEFWLDFLYYRSENDVITEYIKITYLPFWISKKFNAEFVTYEFEKNSDRRNIKFFYNNEMIMLVTSCLNDNSIIDENNIVLHLIKNLKIYGKGKYYETIFSINSFVFNYFI